MQTLVDALERRLEGAIERQVVVTALAPNDAGGWKVQTQGGEREADAIILATPAHTSTRLLASCAPELATDLGAIEYGSSAAVTFGWERSHIEHALNAFGFLVPAIEGSPVMASTWSSIKWPGRAPPGKVLIRIYLGGFHIPDIDGWTDAALLTSARHALARWLGARGEPEWSRVDRYRQSMPRYLVGHEARMKKTFERLAQIPRLELSGNAYQGVGIPDAIRTGEEAAARVLNDLGVLLPRRHSREE